MYGVWQRVDYALQPKNPCCRNNNVGKKLIKKLAPKTYQNPISHGTATVSHPRTIACYCRNMRWHLHRDTFRDASQLSDSMCERFSLTLEQSVSNRVVLLYAGRLT